MMTPTPRTVPAGGSLIDAARVMRDADVGAVIVLKSGEETAGILTDRDIVVRALAEQRDPTSTRVEEICSEDLTTLSPTDSVEDAIRLMREKAVRRLPVVENGHPVGIVSIGDLAIERDPDSALADISAAPSNE